MVNKKINIMKILIIRLSSLGDIVLTQPVAKVLREVYPKAQIDFYTKKQFIDLVNTFGCVDNVLVWKKENFTNFGNLASFRNKYDIVIDLHSKLNTFIIKRMIGVKKTVTYNKKHFLRWLIIRKLTKKEITSTVYLYFSALRKLGIERKFPFPELVPLKENFTNLGNLVSLKSFKKIAIFPGAIHKTKQYPIEQLAEFIDSISAEWNCKFIILGSKPEKELSEKLRDQTKTELIDLCGKFNISQLISAIDLCDVIISNDSGPMHIAAALKKPQIAIFGATHPKLGFAPLNEKAVILKTDIPCQPCSLHGSKMCPKRHFRCMKDISPALLKQNFKKILV